MCFDVTFRKLGWSTKCQKTTWTRSDVDINMCSLCKHWNTAKYDQFNKCCRQLLETTAQQTHSYRLRAHIERTTKIRKEERRECFKMLNNRKTRKRQGPSTESQSSVSVCCHWAPDLYMWWAKLYTSEWPLLYTSNGQKLYQTPYI